MDRRLLLCVPLLLSACVTPPATLSGGPFSEITVTQAQRGDLVGQRVRWGGSLVATTPSKDETCFEVVSRPLDREARPRQTDQTEGRFLACAAGFYDPAVYAPGRELTVIGTLQAPAAGKIGEYEYRYPRVAGEKVFLWPKRVQERVYYYSPWVDPFWYPYPYWYPYWYPFSGPWPHHFKR